MFNGRIYTLTWDSATAVTTALDVFEISPGDDKPIFIHEVRLWQTTDLGDAAEEIIPVSIQRGFSASGSGGGTPTVGKKYAGDAADSFAEECRNTTLATTGTPDILQKDGWNVRVPYIWTPTPPLLPFCSQAQTLIVVRIGAPADSITMDASITVEELG